MCKKGLNKKLIWYLYFYNLVVYVIYIVIGRFWLLKVNRIKNFIKIILNRGCLKLFGN